MDQGDCSAPLPVSAAENSGDISAPVTVALDKTVESIVTKAQERINSEEITDKHARALAENADARIANEIDRQNVENERRAADNEISRKELSNTLFRIKQESKRLREEQRHLAAMQKQAHKAEKKKAYWEAHKASLEQYGMHEGSSRLACNILLFLDGVKGFFLALAKVSDALVKALKWILIILLITGVIMAIPVTRNWILNLLGFIK